MEPATGSEAKRHGLAVSEVGETKKDRLDPWIPSTLEFMPLLGSSSDSIPTRRARIVTLLTKVLGDGAGWYEYEISDDDVFSIKIDHNSGQKWTSFLESFLRQCVRLAGVRADLRPEGKSLNLVFHEYDDTRQNISAAYIVRSRENSRRE